MRSLATTTVQVRYTSQYSLLDVDTFLRCSEKTLELV